MVNPTIVLMNRSNNGIFCSPESIMMANALIIGLFNCCIMRIDNKENYDFNDVAVNYQYKFASGIVPLPEHYNTQEYTDLRNLSIQKGQILYELEEISKFALATVLDFHSLPGVMSFIMDQLDQCVSSEGYYTTAIHEWASIQETSAEAAYQELRIRQEGYSLAHLRNHALYLKYAKNISCAPTLEQAKVEYDRAYDDFYTKGQA